MAKGPGFEKHPGYEVRLEPSPRRLRVKFNGEYILDTTRARLLFETNHIPVYYFPLEDVRTDLMTATDQTTHCPFKGDASYLSVTVGDRTAENTVWTYPNPYDEVPELKGLCAFYWNRVDHWYEEDEEIFVHARDPYKRVDTVQSHRSVRVVVGGETVADTINAHFLFETKLPTRYYIPREDVRMDLLTPTATVTSCPYKGDAIYWSANMGGETFEDIVWSYPEPIAECPKIRDLMCFYNENVEEIYVDGEKIETPKTKWSKD